MIEPTLIFIWLVVCYLGFRADIANQQLKRIEAKLDKEREGSDEPQSKA
jgi:hypothetical protein